MNALSKGLRTKILEHYQYVYGATYKSTAEHFSVGVATVSRLVRHFYKTGDVAVTPPKPKSFHKIDLDWLREKTRNGVDKLIRELVSEYEIERNIKVAFSSMWNALKTLGMSHKKTFIARERESDRVKKVRAEFIAEQAELSHNRLFFLDKSGFQLGSCGIYGWSKKGTEAYGYETGSHWEQ